jgi:hypothetical protein
MAIVELRLIEAFQLVVTDNPIPRELVYGVSLAYECAPTKSAIADVDIRVATAVARRNFFIFQLLEIFAGGAGRATRYRAAVARVEV